jgi:hypothetical protein
VRCGAEYDCLNYKNQSKRVIFKNGNKEANNGACSIGITM